MADGPASATEAQSPEDVYRMLRTRIMTGELVPGQPLTEHASAVRFGLGSPPVRDALTRLAGDGLVQAVSPHAYRITPLTLKSVNDLFAVWALLGPEMAALGTSRADPEQAAQLRQLMVDGNAVLAGPLDRDGVVRFLDITEQTFDLVANASRNDRIIEVYRSLSCEMWRVLALILISADCVDTLLAAGVAWHSVIDRRDALGVTRLTRRAAAATRASAVRLLTDRTKNGDGVVLPLRR
ncbi:GntR family transcriptional regulator [Streptomyces sp. N50]|uniref:GntR family transcriptional regulator n=1 Tax=Streptomyces sp. N50 TaxID=3081765 RepID=UPI002962235F|nr:GntR family transcriptional regulator [Streptomyces sp. N50]WOX15416.1 GntR family transcriptional regulator [Streptomyces sp. N50]